MKILIDMNLSPRWVVVLSAAGISAAHWSSIGSANAPDEEIVTRASEEDWVILTQDLDFGTILAVSNGEKPSVIQIRSEDVSPEAAAPGVVATISQLSAELEQGALVTLDPRQTRVRYLPLHILSSSALVLPIPFRPVKPPGVSMTCKERFE
jgi:predicted nuclease of predicted toxin-antitoxin system